MARSNIANIFHDFDTTSHKFTAEFQIDKFISRTSKSILWDSTLRIYEDHLIMKRYVLVPYIEMACVSISISFTSKVQELTESE